MKSLSNCYMTCIRDISENLEAQSADPWCNKGHEVRSEALVSLYRTLLSVDDVLVTLVS